ncbi:MAG: hypothetical protein ACI8QS_000085 [Planctomycetota bacterium]|jgi:hypothetical protein
MFQYPLPDHFPSECPALIQALCEVLGQGVDSAWTRSSLGCELLFVLSDTIHHYALMAMSVRHSSVEPGPQSGVAPSTLRYWDRTGQGVDSRGTESMGADFGLRA